MKRIMILAMLCTVFGGTLDARGHNVNVVGQYTASTNLMAIQVSGNYAYIAATSGMMIFDIPTPWQPALIGQRPWLNGVDIDISDTLAYYLADGIIRILNIADPINPMLLGQYSSGAYFLSESDGLLCYLGGQHFLNQLDISDPAHPIYAGGIDIYGFWEDVFLSGQYAYVANCDGGLYIVNIADSMRVVANIDSASGAEAVYVKGNFAYIADLFQDLLIYDISDPEIPVQVGHCSVPGSPDAVFVNGSYAYIGTYDHGLDVINISDPANPFTVGDYDADHATTNGLWADENIIYYVAWQNFYILELVNTEISDIQASPTAVSLSLAYPNPFNAQTTISYALPKAGHVTLSVYNVMGQKVATLADGIQQAGEHRIIWDATNTPSGIYFYRLKAGEMSRTEKCILLK